MRAFALSLLISAAIGASYLHGATVSYNTTGSTLSCNSVAGCVQNSSTSITIGGVTFTYNAGSGSGVVTPGIINVGNIVSTGTGTNVNVTGLLLTINVNSTPPGASGSLPNGAISGTISTNTSNAIITFAPNNTTTQFGTLPGIAIGNFTYQVLNPILGLQAPTVGNPVGETSIQGDVVAAGPNPPTITKAFGASNIFLNGTTSLTFTINNPNASATLSGIAFTDTLPAGLVVATPNGLTNTCGGTTTAVAGSGTASLSAGSLAGGASCTVALNVTGTTAGGKNNSVSVTSTEGGTGNTANASVTVVMPNPPTITKAFADSQIQLFGPSNSTALNFTLTNPNTTTTLTGLAFTDTLPSGLSVSTPNGLTGSCGGTLTAVAGSNSISLSGGTLAAGASCTFSVNVTGTAIGVQINTTSTLTSNEAPPGAPATASISVDFLFFYWFFAA